MNKNLAQPGMGNNNEIRKAENNLRRFHGDAAASAVEDAAISYQSPSIIAAGANAQTVSILATLVNLTLSVLCVKAPALIEKIGLTKRGSVTLAFTNMLTWIPLVLIFFLADIGITPAWIAILWMVNIMPAMLVSFQKDNWLSNIVPGRTLGKYLGQRLAIKSGIYLAAFFLLGFMMDRMGEKSLASFGFVCILAVVMTGVDFLIFTFMHDPKKEPLVVKTVLPKEKFGVFEFLADLKKKKLDKFILFTSFINVSIGMGAPFYAVYMLQEKNFSYMSFTIIISVEFLARVVSGPFWGKFADKAGNIKVLTIVSRIVPVLPICWLFSTNIGYLAFIQILSGICWGAFDLSTQSYLYKVAPQPRKLRYIVFTRSLMLFSVALGGIAGSFLVPNVFTIFGSKLLSVFMISGLLRAGIVIFLLPRLIDLAVIYGIPQRVKMDLSLSKKAAVKNGLFYHNKQEPEVVPVASNVIDGSKMHQRNPAMEQRLMETQAAKNQINLLTEAVQKGHKRNWALEAAAKAQENQTERNTLAKKIEEKTPEYERVNVIRRDWVIKGLTGKYTREPEPTVEITPTRRPWFGDTEISANYRGAIPVMAAAGKDSVTMSVGKTANRGGLFYNGTGWARYKEDSLQKVIKEKAAYKASAKPKRACV